MGWGEGRGEGFGNAPKDEPMDPRDGDGWGEGGGERKGPPIPDQPRDPERSDEQDEDRDG